MKKGDSADLENYRPISLLRLTYKIYAKLLKDRIEAGAEKEMWKTQFGFRKNMSTIPAMYCVRSIQDYYERSGEKCSFVLLDWEKAFDKISHDKIFQAMERLGVDDHLI